MKLIKSGLFTVLLLLAQLALAQAPGMKAWSLQQPLQWTDFTGKPDSPELIYAAATYAGLELDVAEVSFSGLVTFKVRAVFDSHRSWAHADRLDDEVLAHEQLHFDITEVYARRLERKLNALKLRVRDKEAAKKLVLKYNAAQMQEQERFDKECVHGINREHQQVWRAKVDRELRIKRVKPALTASKTPK